MSRDVYVMSSDTNYTLASTVVTDQVTWLPINVTMVTMVIGYQLIFR